MGTREDGREDVLRSLGRALERHGVGVGGFIQTPLEQGVERVGYDVVSMASGEHVALARGSSSSPEMCNWAFADSGFARARDWALEGPHGVAFLEAGRLEAAERGHWPAILDSLRTRPLTVLGIRRTVLSAVALRLPDPVDALELPSSRDEAERFIQRVISNCGLEVNA